MTLILGINLSDRLYLATDTQVTNIGFDGKHTKGIDNQLKSENISQHIMVACSGNGKMASFLVCKIKQNYPGWGIRELRKNIESFINPFVDEFFIEGNKLTSKVTITFAGIDFGNNKKISFERYFNFTKQFQKDKQSKIDTEYRNKDLSNLNREELLFFTNRAENSQMGMKDVIFKALKSKKVQIKDLELQVPDSHIFQLRIDRSAPFNEQIKVKDCNYGEWIVSGSVEKVSDISQELMMDLEFNKKSGNLDHDSLCMAIAVADKFSDTIGGSVITSMINKDGCFVFTNTLMRFGKTLNTPSKTIYNVFLKNGILHKKTKRGLFIEFRKLTEQNYGQNHEI